MKITEMACANQNQITSCNVNNMYRTLLRISVPSVITYSLNLILTSISAQTFKFNFIKKRANSIRRRTWSPTFLKFIKLIERTNKMQPCSRIYYSNVSQLLNMFRATHCPSSGISDLFSEVSKFQHHKSYTPNVSLH
jgi:hypothetical protein